jgi:HD-GYP domain-containing protein (c-di-GMP phosphodiesterase class II)
LTDRGLARRAAALADRAGAVLTDVFERASVEPARALGAELAAFVAPGRGAFRALAARVPGGPGPAAHALGVAVHAVALARQLDLAPAFQAALAEGALLHDLGRTLLPAALVDAAPPRGTEAWHVVAEHPRLGVDLAAARGALAEATRVAILSHHERLDGGGYPAGLRGDEVPLPARLVALADEYDHRVRGGRERAPLAPADALEALREECLPGLDRALLGELVSLLARSDDAW